MRRKFAWSTLIKAMSDRQRPTRSKTEFSTETTNTSREGESDRQTRPDATLSTPVDPKEDQVEATRRVLREMWDKAERAIDEQTGRSTRLGSSCAHVRFVAIEGKADIPFCTAHVPF